MADRQLKICRFLVKEGSWLANTSREYLNTKDLTWLKRKLKFLRNFLSNNSENISKKEKGRANLCSKFRSGFKLKLKKWIGEGKH